MLKKVVAASAAVLMMAGTAAAATREINLYGASAQYLFWNDAAGDFLRTKNCTVATDREAVQFDSSHGITVGTNCGAYGGDTVVISYTSKASFDGVMAANSQVHPDAANTGCTAANERKVATYNVDQPEYNPVGTLALDCRDITLGASDVAAESFIQISSGKLKGPNTGSTATASRNFVANPVDGSGMITYNPLIVPFAPFLSKDVTLSTCDGGTNAGEMCATTGDCPGSTCSAKELDNVSREMLVQIFSGNAWYWSDFGAGFPAEPITVCLRHAGSGTHATLDLAIMNSKWGAGLAIAENAADPIIWFNDGSSDEMKCINGNYGTTYAIGYADADQLEGTSSYPNVYQPKYNGFAPTRVNIRNGLYDWWSAQWMYEAPGELTNIHKVITDLVAFASLPANIPSTKAKFWAAQNEMTWMKGSDFKYPTFQGANDPQTP